MSQNMKEILQSGGVIKAGKLVACKLIPKMEIYGFVPHLGMDNYLDFNMRDTRVVSNRIVINSLDIKACIYDGYGRKDLAKARVYPIYKVLEMSTEEQRFPLQFLRVVALEDDKHYLRYQAYGDKAENIKCDKIRQETQKDGAITWSYKIEKGDFVLHDMINAPFKCVAPCFAVLCRRINSVTGCMTYELYDAEDLFFISDNDNI